MFVIGWRAWFDNGRVYDSRQHTWSDLPDDGVLVIMLYHASGTKRILSGSDYYFLAQHPEGPIYGQDRNPPDPARFVDLQEKRGRWVPDHVQERAEHEANASTWGV